MQSIMQSNTNRLSKLKLYVYLSRLNTIKLSSGKMAVGFHYTATLWM